MKLIFISDLHLSPNTQGNNQLFLSLMQQWVNNIDGLYILGDFFDYWLGDDDDNQFISEIKACFKGFTKYTPIYFIGGNHDFALGNKFANETGIKILQDCYVLEADNRRILLSHGDRFCTLDISYQRMKKILQNPLIVYLLKKIPLAWRYKLKNKLEKESNTSYNQGYSYKYKVVDNTIAKHIAKYRADTVIHGHTHDPGYYTVQIANDILIPRIEIPDWANSNSGGFVVMNNGKITICTHQRDKNDQDKPN